MMSNLLSILKSDKTTFSFFSSTYPVSNLVVSIKRRIKKEIKLNLFLLNDIVKKEMLQLSQILLSSFNTVSFILYNPPYLSQTKKKKL